MYNQIFEILINFYFKQYIYISFKKLNILSTIKFLRLIFYTSSNFFHRLKQAPPRSMISEYFYYTRSISDSIFFFNRIYASVMAPRRHPLFTPYDTRIRMGRRTRHIRRHTYACTIPYIRIYKYTYVCVCTHVHPSSSG